jgi:uncharacterized protein YndB with AHSA1/START domain
MPETTTKPAQTAGTTDTSLRITRRIRATPEELFDAWTDADGMRTWMTPADAKDARAVLDVRVGGKFEIDMIGPRGTHEHRGEYLVVDRPKKLSFTWVSVHVANLPTVVTLEFKALSKEETELTLTHEGFPSVESRNGHLEGWGMIVDKLASTIGK